MDFQPIPVWPKSMVHFSGGRTLKSSVTSVEGRREILGRRRNFFGQVCWNLKTRLSGLFGTLTSDSEVYWKSASGHIGYWKLHIGYIKFHVGYIKFHVGYIKFHIGFFKITKRVYDIFQKGLSELIRNYWLLVKRFIGFMPSDSQVYWYLSGILPPWIFYLQKS